MPINMPTFVLPSDQWGVGNGTVDITQPLTVSWQVNGNSAMTAFQIVIYQNDTSSTQLYSTGRRTDNCPFQGKDNLGNYQIFSYTIPSSDLTGAGLVNGGKYKLVITQWWNSADYVVQNSASAFITRAAPTLTINTIPNPLAARDYTFQATYSQAQGDALNWVRWQIAYADDTDNPFYDTQNIYGTAQLEIYYNGFFTDTNYVIRCSVQTENGVETDTGWVSFSVQYTTTTLSGYVTASKACGDKSAVNVSWDGIRYIYGEADGDYSIQNGILSLPEGSSVSWNEVSGEAMAIPTPWNIVWQGVIQSDDATLFSVSTTAGEISFSYTYPSRTLSLKIGSTELATLSGVRYDDTVTALLTPTQFYIRRNELTGGLFPSAALYPNTTLYPQASTELSVLLNNYSVSYSQSAITKVFVGGKQDCDYLQIINGTLSEDIINSIYTSGTYIPSATPGTYFLSEFDTGLNAGSIYVGDDPIEGWAVYRRTGDAPTMQYIVNLPLNADEFLDYGAASQQGPYVYYIFPIGSDTYISTPLISNSTNPCLWNWTVLACTKEEDGHYTVEAEYTFGKNLTSGSISNNNTPTVSANFTKYPTIQQSSQNYKSGTLQSLIGVIDYTNGNQYSETLALRDAIYNLSTSSDTLFLKSRKGDLMEIKIGAPISMTTMDGTREQAQMVSLPWVEIADAAGVSIVSHVSTE